MFPDRRDTVVTLALFVTLSVPGLAQDRGTIRGAVTDQVHGKSVGTIASWHNPASGNSGSIKLVKKLTRKNQQCEDVEYVVR